MRTEHHQMRNAQRDRTALLRARWRHERAICTGGLSAWSGDVTIPQRLSFVTLGARNMTVLRGFYAALGWSERPGSDDDFATYDAGNIVLALYPIESLGAEAAPREPLPQPGWNGVTFGINVENADAVDEAFKVARAAGAHSIGSPVRREWGGYSAYMADPEGNRWEIAWAPEA